MLNATAQVIIAVAQSIVPATTPSTNGVRIPPNVSRATEFQELRRDDARPAIPPIGHHSEQKGELRPTRSKR
jgi:hypothetical protein